MEYKNIEYKNIYKIKNEFIIEPFSYGTSYSVRVLRFKI